MFSVRNYLKLIEDFICLYTFNTFINKYKKHYNLNINDKEKMKQIMLFSKFYYYYKFWNVRYNDEITKMFITLDYL